jgi:hypothetical protein
MPGLLERLFGPRRPQRDYHRGPKLAGIDPIGERAIGLQKRYWSPAPDELRELEGRGLAAIDWVEKLRLHHLRCLALLDGCDGLLRRGLLASAPERPGADELERAIDPALRERVAASAKALLGRRSPYRPRHGFAWLGDGPPEGDAVPYSDFQGRIVNASLTHLGCVEIIRLDPSTLEPAALEFVAFDEIMTLARGPRSSASDPFVPARILREYGQDELVVLLPLRHGLSWFAREPELLRGEATHEVAAIELRGLADPTKAFYESLDRRMLGIAVGPQRLEVLSDFAQEGLGRFELGGAYQMSLAIDQDDPRFDDKCRGRGLDVEATRGDVVRESRLRASAKAARKGSSPSGSSG